MLLKRIINALLICFIIVSPIRAFTQAQGTQTDFGKNRVQYKGFQWFYYRSPHFDTYYYKNGKELGVVVGKLAEQNLSEIENILDYKLEGRIKILAYNKLSDLKQTNLGLVTDVAANTGGLTQIVGNKVFIYFDGSITHLRKQVRAGIAQVLINEMLYGGNIQEMLSNSTLLNLPSWFMPGLVSYISEEWNIYLDNDLKDGILSGRYKKFNRLLDNDARIAGHSIWKYVVDNFGLNSISNIVYMTRVNKNVETGFAYILGLNFKELSPKWIEYYKSQYNALDEGKLMPSDEERFLHKGKKKNRKYAYNQFKISPDGKRYAYIINKSGRFSVYIYDLTTEKTKRVFKAGLKTQSILNENLNPLLAWHPSGILLAVSYEKRSEQKIEVININDKKENIKLDMYKYEKILDFDYSSDGRKWVFSAVRNGQSDIYVFDIASRRDEQITNDWYDDLNPKFIQRTTNIIFSSNRSLDSLHKEAYQKMSELNNYDLFVYDYAQKDPVLKRVTNTSFTNETLPVELDTNKVVYLSDEGGIINRHLAVFDSVIAYAYDTTIFWYDTTITVYKDTFNTYPVSNYARNIIDHDVSKRNPRISELMYHKGQFKLFIQNRKPSIDTVTIYETPYGEKHKKALELINKKLMDQRHEDSIRREDSVRRATMPDSLLNNSSSVFLLDEDKDTYYFQTDFPRKKSKNTKEKTHTNNRGERRTIYVAEPDKNNLKNAYALNDYFAKSSPIPYLPTFSTNFFVSQLDNSLLANTYQQFTGVGPIFFNSSVNALIKVGTSDLLEDFRFTGGFRLSGNLTVPEYYLSFENLKKRLDKQFVFYKQGGDDFSGFGAVKTNSYEFRTIGKYPLDEQKSIRGSIFYRRDETIFLSTDIFSLTEPNRYEDNIGLRLEYVYDNTINKGVNLYNGTRYKFYIEQYNQLGKANDNMVNVGFDFRHYAKISRQIIFAGRVAGSSSIADQKVMYYLGSVDNWIIPRFNNNIQIDQTRNYKYQALATNLRGFTQNIRNGNTFMVVNTEVRAPIFSYLINRPIRSDFIKNFQLVPFGDIGAAWLGSDPLSDENIFNRVTVQPLPVKVTVVEPKFPIVGGFGGGVRTRLLGYFIRFDTAWGVQNAKIERRPVYYFSLSLDF